MMKRSLYILSPILTIIMIWYLLFFIIDEPLIVPSFNDVMTALFHLITSSKILPLFASLLRLLLSFIFSALSGITLGFIGSKYALFERFNRPFVTILRVIPVLSIIVILFIIVGSTFSPYIITFLIIFPLFYQATLEGMKQIDPALIDVLKLNEMHRRESFKYVYIPCLADTLFLTMFQTLGLGIKVLVMAEYLMQTKQSMGNAIYLAKIQLNYQDVYAWTVILILLAIMLESIALGIKKKHAN